MPKKAAIFEKTYRDYLKQISDIDFLSRANMLGAEVSGDALVIPFYGKPYRVSKDSVIDPSEKTANFAVSVVLCKYILECPEKEPISGDWVTYREFKDAGPLVGYFTNNTNKIIETTFAGNTTSLEEAIQSLGGTNFDDGSSYDISKKLDFLPKIPVLLRFNDSDDEFPAQCAILFRRSAEKYLDMESLAIGGTFLAGVLIGNR